MPCKVKYFDEKGKLGINFQHHTWFEFDQFLPLVSYYLPDDDLHENEAFKSFLREKSDLVHSYAD